jgi:hypothetical protein
VHAGHGDRVLVQREVLVAHEAVVRRMEQQRRRVRRRRRLRGELAVDRDDRSLRGAAAHAAVGQLVDVQPHVVDRPLAVHAARVGAAVDVGLDRVEDRVGALAVRDDRGDVRQHVDRGIEEHDAADQLGVARGELEDQPAAERVTDPVDGAEVAERLDEVGDVLLERPRRLPAGAAVAAQVGREHVEP